MTLTQYLAVIIKFLQEQVQKAQAKGVIVGLSGGIDSALVALLMQKAFPDNHLCLILPCQSNTIDETYAQNLAQKHHLNVQLIDLTNTYQALKLSLKTTLNTEKAQLILGNMKARIRMTTLYALAQNHNYLVVGTDNADEWHIGYFTKYGDGASDLLPIIHLLKKDIIAAAQLLDVNEEIIIRKPTASLWEGQTDEGELGFTYDQLDHYLLGNSTNIPLSTINKIKTMHQNSQHKRTAIAQAPPWKHKS